MPSDHPTREELLEQVKSLKLQLSQSAFGRPAQPPVQPHAQPHDTAGQHTVIRETPQQTTIETKLVPPTAQRSVVPKSVARSATQPATPEQIVARITAIRTVIASGVEGAGYGDKRTDFRSLAELRQILNDLEEELAGVLGLGGRVRQIRMTTSADKGL